MTTDEIIYHISYLDSQEITKIEKAIKNMKYINAIYDRVKLERDTEDFSL